MRADDIKLQGLLNSPNQYVIPVFQRYYCWVKEDWDTLWDDLMELIDPEAPSRSHFMGSLVFVPGPLYVDRIPTFQVIDGQQRILTLSLLLCALRDCALSRGFESLSDEIIQTFLVHPFRKGPERLRVYPRHRDRDAYIAAVNRQEVPPGRVREALRFFSAQLATLPIANSEEGLHAFFALLQTRLEFVHITLEGDNPYRIFKSLNSTGVDLSEADLIRNFVFLHIDLDEQDQFDDRRWKPLEQRFEDSNGNVDNRLLSSFFRDHLMCSGQYVPLTATFQVFERAYQDLPSPPLALAEDLRLHAALYDIIRGTEQHADRTVEAALVKLRQLESSTTYPLLLNLMMRVRGGTLRDEGLAQAIELLAGFILRRFICGDSSRGYGRWFVAACRELGADPVGNLRSFLVQKGSPGDALFTAQFVRTVMYGSRYCRYILEMLERAQEHKESADLSKAQIEHIMPRTLSDRWRSDLGSDPERIHNEWLHTVGNLTLSAYNPELSNRCFAAKREEYGRSNISLTRQVTQYGSWTEAQIQDRGRWLANLAAKTWMAPHT